MGHIFVRVRFRGTRGERTLERVLVDTGSTRSVLPPEIAQEIGAVELPGRARMETINGRIIEAKVMGVEIEIEGRRGTDAVVVFDGAPAVIGTVTLEILGLRANPVEERLEPIRPNDNLLAWSTILTL